MDRPSHPEHSRADVPEADLQEQARTATDYETVDPAPGHERLGETVDEGDWLEQSITESDDREDHR